MQDFHSILITHGFIVGSYDFESTIVGFDYDIQFSLFNATIFDISQSTTHRYWDNPDALIRCDLVTYNGDIDTALQFFSQQWSTELKYQNPVREIIDIHQYNQSATIHVLIISKHNAMTILFNIK